MLGITGDTIEDKGLKTIDLDIPLVEAYFQTKTWIMQNVPLIMAVVLNKLRMIFDFRKIRPNIAMNMILNQKMVTASKGPLSWNDRTMVPARMGARIPLAMSSLREGFGPSGLTLQMIEADDEFCRVNEWVCYGDSFKEIEERDLVD